VTHRDPNLTGRAAPLVAIGLAAAAVFAGTLSHEFVHDDLALIPDHPAITHPWDAAALLGSTYWASGDNLYRPLTLWTFALNHGANRALGLAGDQPAGYHVVNVLLHLAVACTLYRLLRELDLSTGASTIAALVFAVHPLHTEAVAPVVGRSELLAGGFGLLFLIAHRRGRPLSGALCFLLAIGSKESAAAFLPLALWGDLCWARQPPRRTWTGYALAAAALGGYLALRAAAVPPDPLPVPHLDNPLVRAPLAARWLTAAAVQLAYLRLQLLPLGLSADYSFDQIPLAVDAGDARVWSFLAIAAGAGAVAWRLRRAHPFVPFAIGGYTLLFLPTSNLLFPIGTIMGERLAYAPSLATCALAGFALGKARDRWGRFATAGVVLIVVALGILTVQRNRTWADTDRFVRALVTSAPRSAKAHFLLARHENDAGRFEAAIPSAQRAIEIHPGYAEAWNELGRARATRGDPAGAVAALERAVALSPGWAEAWSHLGRAFADAGAHGRSLAAFETARAVEPASPGHHFGAGLALQRLGQLDDAAEAYAAALRLRPDHAPALTNLGSIRASEGRLDEARELWRRALLADPTHAAARQNLERLERLDAAH
jgi:tetratricopeptide (TPR) repeat protein